MPAQRVSRQRPQPVPASLALVDDANEQRELEQMRGRNIAAQDWMADRAFAVGFQRGEEIAWGSLDEFQGKRQEYLGNIQRRRRGKVGRVGERKNRKYGAFAAWATVRWSLLGMAALIFFYVAQGQGFWLPRDESARVWVTARERAAWATATAVAKEPGAVATVGPVAVQLVDLGVPLGDREEDRPGALVVVAAEQARRSRLQLSAKVELFAIALFLWWLLRYVLFRPRVKVPEIPTVIRLDTLPE